MTSWASDRGVLAMLDVVRVAPHDDTPRLVLADLCAERGYRQLEVELREPPPNSESDGDDDGSGDGGSVVYEAYDTYGDGGVGDGGTGDGGDDGGGNGGYGNGGYFSGAAARFNPGVKQRCTMRSEGERVLVLIPGSYRSFVYCGKVGPCVGAHTYRLLEASLVLNSGNGRDWPALARGMNRSLAIFSYVGEADIGPQFGGVFEWAGDLPPGPKNGKSRAAARPR